MYKNKHYCADLQSQTIIYTFKFLRLLSTSVKIKVKVTVTNRKFSSCSDTKVCPHIQNKSNISLHHCSTHPGGQGSLKTGQQHPVRNQDSQLSLQNEEDGRL